MNPQETPSPMNDDDELHLTLPPGMLAEIDSRAASRGITRTKLIGEVFDRAEAKGEAYLQEMKTTAEAVARALRLRLPEPWPEDFEDRLVVGLFIGEWENNAAEAFLLAINGPEMDLVEAICREKGISYDEFTRLALKRAERNDEPGDPAEGWKQ
jgi:hypothetical protein